MSGTHPEAPCWEVVAAREAFGTDANLARLKARKMRVGLEDQATAGVRTAQLKRAALAYQRNIHRVNSLTMFPLIVTRIAWKSGQFLAIASTKLNESMPSFGGVR
jgi:hypothetical protein